MDKIWILTEEKPKKSVIHQIVKQYCLDFRDDLILGSEIKIKPIFENGLFSYRYKAEGISTGSTSEIIIKTVSGSSSFLDFLLFKQENEPAENGCDSPLMAIEETKTSDDESRNTGVYQRGSKFVFIEAFYRSVKLYMLYNEELECRENKKPSDTSIFGTNILLTLGVTVLGKQIEKWFRPFTSIDDLISFKSQMRRPPAGNVPIQIIKEGTNISISGRLAKPADEGNIGHDPNIGALSMISKCIRVLGWTGDITIKQHAVSQRYINATQGRNKFLYICNLLNLKMEGVTLPPGVSYPESYWHYEKSSEKMASILLHVQAEYCGLKEVYQNHAGCERGYFKTPDGQLIPLPKKDRSGENLLLPDLILWHRGSDMVVVIEGKKISTIKNGLEEIELYDSIENEFIKRYYPGSTIVRGVCIYGGNMSRIPDDGVMFYLTEAGRVFVNPKAPACIKDAFSHC